jgi:hypothetical protein
VLRTVIAKFFDPGAHDFNPRTVHVRKLLVEPLKGFPVGASLFILSDAARYQGQSARLLGDHPEEAVLIERLLEVAIRKIPQPGPQ